MTNKNLNLPSGEIDEALWAAYRRDDKAAVTDYLFRRTFVGFNRSTSFRQLVVKRISKSCLAARRAQREAIRINGGARQMPLRSGLN